MRHGVHHAVRLAWLIFVAVVLILYFFRKDLLEGQLAALLALPLAARYGLYLALGCLRGFTLIPVTSLILLGLVLLPSGPLYVLTLIGVLVSSAVVYRFSGFIHLGEFFERHYPRQISKLKTVLERRELPIVITWSALPFTPTDLICYVCGSLGVNLKKLLLGVLIGEGFVIAAYIFLAKELLTLAS